MHHLQTPDYARERIADRLREADEARRANREGCERGGLRQALGARLIQLGTRLAGEAAPR